MNAEVAPSLIVAEKDDDVGTPPSGLFRGRSASGDAEQHGRHQANPQVQHDLLSYAMKHKYNSHTW